MRLMCFCFLLLLLLISCLLSKGCVPKNSAEFETCLNQKRESITLISGTTYSINTASSYIVDNLVINSTELEPAILKVENVNNSNGLLRDGSVEIYGVHIKGGKETGGPLMKNMASTTMKNCTISDYDITSASTKLIAEGKIIKISECSFLNNIVHSTETSPDNSANLIETSSDENPQWDISFDSCVMKGNKISASNTVKNVNLFIYMYKYS